ncbi:MAG TPA: RNB domain-containing ribonuclease [Steroidobacteraceae bacterium]|jgi:exoribonuclease-2
MAKSGSQSDTLRSLAADAMRSRGMLPDFSAAALAEAGAAQNPAVSDSVRDLRAMLWSSIDNDDSLDLDQIEVAERLSDGRFTLYVAIADVDSLVPAGSAIDEHAAYNTTSVYTAARVFPMLPEHLSTDLSSLRQDQERLAIVTEMTLQGDGTLVSADRYRARVKNYAKLAYRSVAAWLDGTAAPPEPLAKVKGMDGQLRLQDQIAQLLQAQRRARGALELETIEDRPVFEGDNLVDLRPDPKNRAQSIIEEFMVAANGANARYLDKAGRSSIRRVLKTPKRWGRIVELAKGAGTKLPEEPDAKALDDFLLERRRAVPQSFGDLSLSIIKCLGPGEYALERPGETPVGHFGLAVRDYTHSTAPNRRYPDLLTQRLMKAALNGGPAPYSDEQLKSLAAHCTAQEDSAKKVERQVAKSAAAMLLSSKIGMSFEAIVTGASDKGTWVRIEHPAAEGRVVKNYQGLDVGDHVQVKLVHTDVTRGFIDFAGLK